MKVIELTVIEASQVADLLEEMYISAIKIYGTEKLPQVFVTGNTVAEEIMSRVKAKLAGKD